MFLNILPFILVPFILATGVALMLLAAGALKELDEKAPAYAHKLYRSLATQLCARAYPRRGLVLFFTPAPIAVKGTITALRLIFVFHLALLISLVVLIF